MRMHLNPWMIVSAVMGLSACGGKGNADQSYCQSLCDWAVECASSGGDVDADGLMAECLSATSAASATCAEFDAGDMSRADELILGDCNTSIAESVSAGECDAFTGTLAAAERAQPPATCNGLDGAQDAFDAAQETVFPGSEEVCEDLADAFCGKLVTCIEDSAGHDDPDGLAYDACMTGLSGRVSECIDNDTYAADITNSQREGADRCIVDMAEASCDDLFSGSIPAVCSAAFVDASTAASYASDIGNIASTYASGG